MSQVQKRVKVRLGQSVRLNCHDSGVGRSGAGVAGDGGAASGGGGNIANKWRPHTKWKHTKWYKNGRRLVQNALPQNISIKKRRWAGYEKKEIILVQSICTLIYQIDLIFFLGVWNFEKYKVASTLSFFQGLVAGHQNSDQNIWNLM